MKKYFSILLVVIGILFSIWGITGFFNSNKTIERTNAVDLAIESKRSQKSYLLTIGAGIFCIALGIAASKKNKKKS